MGNSNAAQMATAIENVHNHKLKMVAKSKLEMHENDKMTTEDSERQRAHPRLLLLLLFTIYRQQKLPR